MNWNLAILFSVVVLGLTLYAAIMSAVLEVVR